MSASIGEPGHETSGWTHACCDNCWYLEGRPDIEPTRVLAHDDDGNLTGGFHSEPCCFCGQPTQGVYLRKAAPEMHRVRA